MTDEAPYEVIRSVDGVELRRYPELVLATVSGMEDNSSFGILFEYITGNNVNVSISRRFTAPGTYVYTCHIHPGMQGTVVVQ